MKSVLAPLSSLSCLSYTLATPTNPQHASGIHTDPKVAANQTFDYIIAGGGLTGLTVASRLTEDPSISVLVIEAGDDAHANPKINDVRTYGQAFSDPDLDHGIYSTPVDEQDGKQLQLIAGKTLGGSGSLNGASWTKAPKSQYDLLATLTGDNSWGWEGLNKYMLKAENFHNPGADEIADGAQWLAAAHGTGGPVQVSFAKGIFGGIQQPALEACQHVWPDMQLNPDAASGDARGATIIPNMVHPDENQNRSSPFTAYAQQQVHDRPNFTILTGHRVTEILWSNTPTTPLTATGVYFQSCPTCPLHTALLHPFGGGEILLAAGALQSPQLLELSGVGDPAVLAAAGIPLRLAAPGVGKNLQEQTKNTLLFRPKNQTAAFFGGTGPSSAIAFPDLAQLFGGGNDNATLMNLYYNDLLATLPSHVAALAADGYIPATTTNATTTILQLQLRNLLTDRSPAAEIFFTTSPALGLVGADIWNLIVLSRGSVHVRSRDPWEHPAVDPNYFGHSYEMAVQRATARFVRRIFSATPPLADLIDAEVVPGLDTVGADAGSEAWEAWVKRSFTSVWHPIATLAMMQEEWGGVVDARLRVYGTGNVRCVDAGVVPVQLSAHLSGTLYGVAEKAGVMVKEDREGKRMGGRARKR